MVTGTTGHEPLHIPRILIAAPASGGGKTTVATGLMAALRATGRQVAPFKVGPDYIDPGYHGLATGRPGRNLDSVMCGSHLMAPLLAHGFATPEPADVAVIEGVMGLFDGRLGDGAGSSAQIATLTDTPVVLVVDASHASLTHAAVVAGLAGFDPDVRVAGAILNKVGSARHGAEIRRGIEGLGIPVLGEIPRDPGVVVPSRHLGLVPAAERDASAAQVQALAGLIAGHVDLDAVMEVASSAPDLDTIPWDPHDALRSSDAWDALARNVSAIADSTRDARPATQIPGGVEPPLRGGQRALASVGGVVSPSPTIAIFSGRAFTFRYAETTELLEAAGCRVVDVDPLADTELPQGCCGLYLGGGFPEMHAEELSANRSLHESIRAHVDGGMPVVAECAGLLMLCRTLDGHPMTGALSLDAAMRRRLTMGYRDATAPAGTLLARAGERVIGHEFHRTGISPVGEQPDAAWTFTMPDGSVREEGVSMDPAGLGHPSVHASYLHLHWAGAPACAARFAAAAWQYLSSGGATPLHSREPDLSFHGDQDAAPGLVDLAVNVRVDHTPDWLVDAITASASTWQAYPDPAPARAALARHHGVDPSMLLPTNGGAEAFVLVARALHPRHAVVVHPQFTEPEAALRAAGHDVDRLILGPGNGFALDPAAVLNDADLVIIGNPTNPTGALHPAADLSALARPGRVLVVDEAFMDATDGAQSLIGPSMDGVLVLRSLTKTYGLAGIRAGYAVGDPEIIVRLAAQQQAWAVSTPGIAAMIACCTDAAEQHRARLAAELPTARDDLTGRLRPLGLRVIDSGAPFVLVDTSSIGPCSVREPLARLGFAVRRGETFPGLGPTWIRLAVRDAATHASLADALAGLITTEPITTKENR